MNINLSLFALTIFAFTASAAHAQMSGFSTFAPVNGSAVNSGTSLALTSNSLSQAGSAFSSTAQDISRGLDASLFTPSLAHRPPTAAHSRSKTTLAAHLRSASCGC